MERRSTRKQATRLRHGRRAGRGKVLFGAILLACGAAYDASAVSAEPCFRIAERNYESCKAKCEYQVESSSREFSYSPLGAFNNWLMDFNDRTFQRAVREGVLPQWRYDTYQSNIQASRNLATALSIGNCHSQCGTEYDEMRGECLRR